VLQGTAVDGKNISQSEENLTADSADDTDQHGLVAMGFNIPDASLT